MMRGFITYITVFIALIATIFTYTVHGDEDEDIAGRLQIVRSFLGNYTVIAHDIELAATVAKDAEDYRKAVAGLLGDTRNYNIATHITILPADDYQDETGMLHITVQHGGITRTTGEIFRNRLEFALRNYVVFFYLIDVAATSAAENNSSIREDQIPPWITAAILENLTREDRDAHRSFMVETLEENKYLSFEQIFASVGKFESEEERAGFFHQCGSLLDYLVSLPDGRSRVLRAIRDIYQRRDLAISLMAQFRNEFASVQELEDKWLEFTKKRPVRYFDFQRLTFAEAGHRLEQALRVEIISINEKTITETSEVTDFAGLLRHRNDAVRDSIVIKKLAEFHDLKLRSPDEYQEILDEYIFSLRAIGERRNRAFRNHYSKAQTLQTKLLESRR